jgi:CHAP domain
MGNGHSPGSWNGSGSRVVIDDGTSARTGAPPPGAIGLQGSGGGARQAAPPSVADRITAYARRRLTQAEGNGQCFTLVDRALRHVGAKSAADFGEITPDADYVWGHATSLSNLRPGDVIQFRDYAFTRTVVTDNARGTSTDETAGDRPHHTAIVERVGADGAVTVLEQNAPEGSPVSRHTLYFVAGTTSNGDTTTTVTVSGSWQFYRAEAK